MDAVGDKAPAEVHVLGEFFYVSAFGKADGAVLVLVHARWCDVKETKLSC